MRCAVIGGGAAGLMAACMLARGGAETRVLERQARVGKKLLATGNGRCNFTNVNACRENYYGARDVAAAVLEQYPPARILAEFERMGIPARIDTEGRAYPASNAAASVLDNLRLALAEAGGAEETDFDAVRIERISGGFRIHARGGATVDCDKVLVATGGRAAPALGGSAGGYELLRQLGHTIVPLSPTITPLRTETAPIRGLKGQRARCVATLLDGDRPVRAEAGEALFTETGVSGICCMQLARAAQYLRDARLAIDFAPDAQDDLIGARARLFPERRLEDFLTGLLTKRLGLAVLAAAGISDVARAVKTLTPAETRAIGRVLRAFPLRITGVLGFESAQETAGGADMAEFDPETLESRRVPGLFIAGEVCDVDGDCGGFNLQWAWASGCAAARGMRGEDASIGD